MLLSRTDAADPSPSDSLSAHTLGVEEELFLVDRASLEPVGCDDEMLGECRFTRGRVVGEMCDGVLELVSPVCRTAGEGVGVLAALRGRLLRTHARALLGAGVHPTTAYGDVGYRRSEHYDAVAADVRSLLRQSAYCGLHVHVGMPDHETTIAAFNGMRKWIPLIQALSANSPFRHGLDSGLASARTVLNHSLPRSGLPRAFRDWEDFETTQAELCRVAEVADGASFWWDMRPHHTLGTLEIRGVDAQSSLRDVAAIVALIHCLACHEALTAGREHPAVEILEEASYRAIRDGLDATLSTGGPLVPVRELARHATDIASGYAPALGCADELAGLDRLLSEGNGAIRQRRAHERGGMPAVLELLRAETAMDR
ncbi:MAG: glutamate--cysteine ligase [Solirubrobacterales bacterium]|nr:glutamate--cysteine ligase [Solirubrobacterales bacterium]